MPKVRLKRDATLSSLDRMQAVKTRWVPQRAPVRVVRLSSRSDFPLVAEGSVTAFIGRRKSKFLSSVYRAVRESNQPSLNRVTKRVWAELKRRKAYTVAEAEAAVSEVGAIAELRYGSKLLADHLTLPRGVDYGVIPLPYNGGRLEAKDFALMEFVDPASRFQFEVVIVIRPPRLSSLERDVLRSVPANLLEMNVSNLVSPGYCVALVLIVTVLTALGEACLAADRIALTAEGVDDLGPLASARELLHLRRQMFQNA